jgi:hypothetical protein
MRATAVDARGRHEASPAYWPIGRPYLAALKDLGLSDKMIAGYFRVEQQEVAVLRTSYGIAEHLAPGRGEPPKRRRFAWRRKA